MLCLWWTMLAFAGDPAVEGRDAMHQGNVRAARSALEALDAKLGNSRQLVANAEVSQRYQLAVAIADLRTRDGDMRAAMRQVWVVSPEGSADPSLLTRSSLITALAVERAAVVARPEVDLPHLRLPEGVVFIDGLELGSSPIYEGRHLVQVQCADQTWSSAWSWMDRPESWGASCPGGELALAGAATTVSAPVEAPADAPPPPATEPPPLLAVTPPPGADPAAASGVIVEVAEPGGPESPAAASPAAEAAGTESPAAESPAAESPAAESPAAESPAVESAATEPAAAPAVPAEESVGPAPREPAPEDAGFIATWTDRLWPLPFLDPQREKRFDPPGRALLVGPTLGFASGVELQFVPKGDEGGFFATASAGYIPLRLSVSELGVGWQPANGPHIGVEARGGIGLWHDHILYTDGLLYISGAVGARYDPPGPGLTAFVGGGRVANFADGWWVPRATVGWQF